MSKRQDFQDILQQKKFNWVKHELLPLFGLLSFVEEDGNGFFSLPLSKENLILNLERISRKHGSIIQRELEEFETDFHDYIEVMEGTYRYLTGITTRIHPPAKGCPLDSENSTIFYILKPTLTNSSKNALKKLDFSPSKTTKEIFSECRTIEDLLFLYLLKRVTDQCKSRDYYQFDITVKNDLRELMEIAEINQEIIECSLDFNSPFSLDFDKMKKFLPKDDLLYATFFSHDFNTNTCYIKNNISIKVDLAQYLNERLEEISFSENLKSAFIHVKQQILKNEERVPLFNYKDYRYKFMQEYSSKLTDVYSKLYGFEIEDEEFEKALKYLEEKSIIEIKDDEVVLTSEDKFHTLFSNLREKENERIQKNKKELLLKWLRSGVKLEQLEKEKEERVVEEEIIEERRIEERKKTVDYPEVIISPEPPDNEKGIPIYLGESFKTQESVIWYPVYTPLTIYPVMSVIGSMGSGKTQIVKAILHEINSNEALNVDNEPIGLLIFDFKGDYSGEKRPEFLQEFNIQEGLMINPLALSPKQSKAPYRQAVTVAEIFTNLLNLSSTQMAKLRQAILKTYMKAGIMKDDSSTFKQPVPPFKEIRVALGEMLLESKITQSTFDALLKQLDPIFELDLFRGKGDPRYFNKKLVFNLTNLPGEATPKILVEFILYDIYRRMKEEGASLIKRDLKQLRRMIIIDEAHHLLTVRGTWLEKILLEGREFGTGCILSSQYFEHFVGWEKMISDCLILKENQAGIQKNPFKLEPKWLRAVVEFTGHDDGMFPGLYIKDRQRTILKIPAYFKRITDMRQ